MNLELKYKLHNKNNYFKTISTNGEKFENYIRMIK